MGCIRDPTRFYEKVTEVGRRYRRVNIVKHWNVCCEKCLARPPCFIIVSELSYEDVQEAHALSLGGSLSLAETMLRGNDDGAARDMLDSLRNVARYETATTSLTVKEFARKLSDVYNATIRMDNGSVIHIASVDGKVFAVNLQAFVVVNEADARVTERS